MNDCITRQFNAFFNNVKDAIKDPKNRRHYGQFNINGRAPTLETGLKKPDHGKS